MWDMMTEGNPSPREAIIEACRAAPTPALLFALPAMTVICENDGFRQWGGAAELWKDWPRVIRALERVGQMGIPLEVELPEMGRARGALRLLCTPVLDSGRIVAVMAWLGGPGLADHEVAKKAEQAVAAKSRFLAAASHDLRQPFQAMRLFLGVLTQQASEPVVQRTVEFLGKALTSGEQLLNSLLDISRLDAGMVQARRASTDLTEIIAPLIDEFRTQAEAKGLRLKVQMPGLWVETDPVLLGRILRNFLANAIAYTHRGGILLGVRRQRGMARIEVWDTGYGIPSDKIAEIFEEFSQLENPERDRSRGMGLGLAIVRRVSGLLDAPVEVRSSLGRGSAFSVTIPLAEAVASEVATIRESSPSGNGQTVLVVEDDALVLSGLQCLLESWDYAVLPAESMASVLQVLDQAEPDLILSDLRLRGGLTGFEVIDRVRQMMRREVPAILLTGDTGEKELVAARDRGMDLLHKPIGGEQLKTAINHLIRH